MNKGEIKLSDKELHKAIDNLKGTQFLDSFCILDWIVKTRDENKLLQQKVTQLESLLSRETNRKEIATYDNAQLDKQLDLCKSVFDEIKEEIKDLLEHWRGNDLVERDLNTLLTILDKVGGSNE